MRREAVVDGKFYSARAGPLRAHVLSMMPEHERVEAIAAICPHAGLMYSGGVAGEVYASIEPPHTFVLMGPNHTGLGRAMSIMSEGSWAIPTGEIGIDTELASAITSRCGLVEEDNSAHLHEHSLEVQLPFIIEAAPKARMVPIAIMRAEPGELIELGHAIASAIEEAQYPVTIVASSDMSHALPDKDTRELDQMALERVLALDPEGLYSVVIENSITMCGVMPTVAMIAAALRLGAKKAELVRYATSSDVSGDMDYAVGYAGVLIT